jgi:hypothetical protein
MAGFRGRTVAVLSFSQQFVTELHAARVLDNAGDLEETYVALASLEPACRKLIPERNVAQTASRKGVDIAVALEKTVKLFSARILP